VRIGNGDLLEELVHRGAALLVASSISSVTWVPRGWCQSIFLLSKIRGSFFLVSICTSK